MGITYTKVKVRNPLTESKTIELDAKIDTSATLLVLPGEVANELKFPFVRKTPVKHADESRAERETLLVQSSLKYVGVKHGLRQSLSQKNLTRWWVRL